MAAVDILSDAIVHGKGPSSQLGKLFTDHVREIVTRETGLPPCEEVTFSVIEDPVRRAYKLQVTFPPAREGDTVNVHMDIDHLEWASIGGDLDRQLHVLEFMVIKIAHKWMSM